MNISLEKLKKLRNMTKAGVLDCRAALENSGGDLEKAKKWLEKKGLDMAAKKKNKEVKSGVVTSYIHSNNQVGALIKISCETDFVSQTKEFREFANELAMQTAAMNPANIKELMEQEYIRDPKKKIKDLLNQIIAKTAENVKIEAVQRYSIER